MKTIPSIVLTLLTLLISIQLNAQSQGFEHFITADGHKLMDGKKEFRFISFNIPNLNYVEDEMDFTTINPYALPSEYEIRDAMASVQQMGGKVIRLYTIPVRNKNFPEVAPTYVNGPGDFIERAFQTMDTVLALAHEYNIRLIIPFVNNWQWMGGRPNYADFRDKEAEDFWTDKQLIADFKKTIDHIINRKNTVTGIRYKNDKAILCWETGNELQNPHSWLKKIAAYIKSLDSNHLLMDGYYAINENPVREQSVTNPHVDIISTHHYEVNPKHTLENLKHNVDIVDGRKPLILGEFGFVGTPAIGNILDYVIGEERLSGALIWSLRYHHRDGGFYWHSEPLGMGIYKAYHWPGFNSGSRYDEKDLLDLYRSKAFEIQGRKEPPVPTPKSPRLLNIPDVKTISWQGSAGASGYHIERAKTKNGPWTQVGSNISDARYATFPNFHDNSATIGKSYYYRVKALNESGISDPSNIVGPVKVQHQFLIDNTENVGSLYYLEGLTVESGDDRDYKEIRYRLTGTDTSKAVYLVPGSFNKCSIYTFETSDQPALTISVSADNETYTDIFPTITEYASSEQNYNYKRPRLYTWKKGGHQTRYINIQFRHKANIARVVIAYQ